MTASEWEYRGLVADTYDLWFGDEPFSDQAFFRDHVRRNGGVALEIGCGTGRLLVPFLREGLDVEGVDASADMLAICRAKATKAAVSPRRHRQRMQDLDLATRYRTLFVPACSFQILADRAEALATLRRFHQHLEPGGELLISLAVPRREYEFDRQWRLKRSGPRPSDGAAVVIHEATVSDRVEQEQQIWMRYEVFDAGRLVHTELLSHRLRWYYKHEFTMMLASVGFAEVTMQSGYGDADEPTPEVDWVFTAVR